MIRLYLTCLLLICTLSGISQNIPEHISNVALYDFLDELAAEKIISLNENIRPYSRDYIAEKLEAANKDSILLTHRQTKELHYWIDLYAPENSKLIPSTIKLKEDSIFQLSLLTPRVQYKKNDIWLITKVIYGAMFYSNDAGQVRQTWGGAEMMMGIGKHFGFYASLRDNYITNEPLTKPGHLTSFPCGNYKYNEGERPGVDYDETRGGIGWSWKWGNLGLKKDNIQWGYSMNGSNIFSGRNPSVPMLTFNMNPFEWATFDYVHSWLVSEVIDSSRSYYTPLGDYRARYVSKYLAANMYSFTPWKFVRASFGNSIVYSDMDFQPAYLIPFLFFKTVDHTINHGIDNQNSHMFFSLNVRPLKHLHIYATYFVDEFSVTRISDPALNNITSFKSGMQLWNWPLKNTGISCEYYQSNPVTYKHRIPSVTFASNNYNLGHYLGDNSQEIYSEIWVKPRSSMKLKLSYNLAKHGNEYQYLDGNIIDEYPFLQDITLKYERLALDFTWNLFYGTQAEVCLEYTNSTSNDVDLITSEKYLETYLPYHYRGKHYGIIFGFNIGF
ncbi:MAG: hypothetical protein V1904_13950 [Bacteroidota bacterium]